jgi:hypothetical protein
MAEDANEVGWVTPSPASQQPSCFELWHTLDEVMKLRDRLLERVRKRNADRRRLSQEGAASSELGAGLSQTNGTLSSTFTATRLQDRTVRDLGPELHDARASPRS